MTIATLGPEGTYSVQAARSYQADVDLSLCNNIQEVVHRVEKGEVEKGLVPLENSIHGVVAESLDTLSESGLIIQDEVVIDIHHVLCASSSDVKASEVKAIYSHPQALSQCKEYIANNYPEAELITAASTAAAIRSVAKKKDRTLVAIGSEFAAEQYGLLIVDHDIEDQKGNRTKFVVFSKSVKNNGLPFILMAVEPQTDRPGLLYDFLGIIKDQGINMLQIDSRPNHRKPGSYMFYIKLEINSDDSRFDKLSEEAKKIDVKVRKMSV